MRRPILLVSSLLFAAVLGVGGYLGWGLVQELRGEVAELRGSVSRLDGELRQAHERSQRFEARAETAQQRAGESEELAAQLAERAREAEEQAAAARQQAFTERESAVTARLLADTAAAARSAAEERSAEAILEAERARQEAVAVSRRAEELERKREQDLDRLQRALTQIAETRRTALGVVMDLGDSIEFDFDKARLRSQNREVLSRIAGVLLTAEDFGIQVYGHTDDVGSVEYNLELSERRAQTVRDYLVEMGVAPDVIAVKGFGKSVPLVEGTDPEARQRNRRVEIAIVHTSGSLPEDFVAETATEPPTAD